MDTNGLKRFASEARNILIGGVKQRFTALGFQQDGSVAGQPELKGGGAVFMGDVQSEDFYNKWMSLQGRIKSHSYREVAEEAAYTWFNRLVAIRIMVKNELMPPMLEYESDEVRIPLLVSEARQRRFPQMNDESRQKLEALLNNDALTDDQFAVLVVAYCHNNPIINKCFGTISDYTELLLPGNILAKDGFIDKLNADDYIKDEDYRSPELIGWLYQFYISERKDEVFARKGKFEADEIPAATQIFTPNWIVKYMVQNTVGRIYIDNNPDTDIKEGMKYLVEPAEPIPANAIYHFEDIHDLTCADLACGSGHILNECFDLLYQIYIEEGYNRRKAIEDIFRYNLTGIDIDTRAKQLATFALLMKACQKDNSFSDAHCMPKVLNMPVSYAETMNEAFDNPEDERAYIKAMFRHFIMGGNDEILDEITDAIQLMNDAQTLGSIMKFNISERTRNVIAVRTAEYEQQGIVSEDIRKMLPYMRVILALTQNYTALVMNPPYMGGGNMNEALSKYVKDSYEDSKADLFSVFMDVATDHLRSHGKYGMINMQSWMFLSSFEKLRKKVLDNYQIDSMLHLGPRTFDELGGEVVQNTSFVISKNHEEGAHGVYFRLVDGKNCSDKEQRFLHYSGQESKVYYPAIPQSNFEKIPRCPIGYWVSENVLYTFNQENLISTKSIARSGFSTGNNDRYVRQWYEVSLEKIGFNLSSNEEYLHSSYKFVPFTKGGGFRRWYGNLEPVVDWTNPDTMHRPRTTYMNLYYKPAITWNAICSGKLSCRFYDNGFLFEHAAASLFVNSGYRFESFLAYLNTPVFQSILGILNPTLNTGAEVVSSIPIIIPNSDINSIVQQNISISKQDWDAHETSWDFQTNELVALDSVEKYAETMQETYEGTGIEPNLEAPQLGRLEWRTGIYKQKWEDKFNRLHANEEDLNRQFIDIYGLQDELTPDVPLKEVTILQQGEISIEGVNVENKKAHE